MDALVAQMARAAGPLIGATAALVLTIGAAVAIVRVVRARWTRFGRWLLLGLEFAFAADAISRIVLAQAVGPQLGATDSVQPELRATQ